MFNHFHSFIWQKFLFIVMDVVFNLWIVLDFFFSLQQILADSQTSLFKRNSSEKVTNKLQHTVCPCTQSLIAKSYYILNQKCL